MGRPTPQTMEWSNHNLIGQPTPQTVECSTHNLMEQLQNEKLNHTPSFDTGDNNIWFDIWINETAHPTNNGGGILDQDVIHYDTWLRKHS